MSESSPVPPPVPPVSTGAVNPADPRQAAINRLHRKRAFWIQVVGWIIGFLFMTAIWALSGMGGFWPAWVLLVGAFVLAGQGWAIFGQKPITEDEIEREIKKGS